MTDLPVITWSITALAGGTLLVHLASRQGRPGIVPAVVGTLLLLTGVLGGLRSGHAFGPSLVATFAGAVALVQAFRCRIAERERNRAAGLLLIGVVATGVACGGLIASRNSDRVAGGPSVLVLDPETERKELRSTLELAILDLQLILRKDLPARELRAREDQRWQRLETLSRIRSRINLELTELKAALVSLDDPEAPLPTACSSTHHRRPRPPCRSDRLDG